MQSTYCSKCLVFSAFLHFGYILIDIFAPFICISPPHNLGKEIPFQTSYWEKKKYSWVLFVNSSCILLQSLQGNGGKAIKGMSPAGCLEERGMAADAVLCVPREGLERTLKEGFVTCGCQVRGLSFGNACVDGVYSGKRAFALAFQVCETITLDYTVKTVLQSHPDLGEGIYACAASGLFHVLQGKTLPVGQGRNATRSSGA